MAVDIESGLDVSGGADERLQYRAVSVSAVASVVFGLLSFMTIPTALTSIEACLMVSPLPIAGAVMALSSWIKIRRNPLELTGLRLAIVGGVLSAGFLFAGLALAIGIYSTEVPEGYQRISFVEMKPDESPGSVPAIVPPEIMALQGKRVFIKGYMRPPSQQYQIDSFLLVRDNNECCFGDLSKVKYYDQIVVKLTSGLRTDYSPRMFRLAGVLHIEPQNARFGSEQPVYSLTADYIK